MTSQQKSTVAKLRANEAVVAFVGIKAAFAPKDSGYFASYEALFAVPVAERPDLVFGCYQPTAAAAGAEAPAGKPMNLLQALFVAREQADFRSCNFCLLAEANDYDLIPVLFAQGLLAFAYRDKCDTFMQNLRRESEETADSEFAIAGRYLRRFLKDNRSLKDLVDFEIAVLQHPYKDEGQIIRVAEAFFLTDQKDKGTQALLYVPVNSTERFRDQAIALYEQFATYRKLSANVTSYKGGVVIIDSDYNALTQLRKLLTEMEFRNISGFATAADAIQFLSRNPNVKLLFVEWHLKDAPAGGFFDALESAKLPIPAIVLHTNRFGGNPEFLKTEFGVETIIYKDGAKNSVKTKGIIRGVFNQASDLTVPRSLKREIKRCLVENDLYSAKTFMHRFIKMPQVLPVSKEIMIAHYEFRTREFKASRDRLLRCLSERYKATLNKLDWFEAVDLLAQVYYELTDFPNALAYLQKALNIAPFSVRRTCLLAELYGALGDLTKADAIIVKAMNTHKYSIRVKKTALMLKIVDPRRDVQELNRELYDMNVHEEVYQQLNGMAIKKIKNAMAGGDTENNPMFQEAINFYKMCLSSIPDKQRVLKATVTYNMCLAYCRINAVAPARKLATEACSLIDGLPETSSTRLIIRKIKKITDKLTQLPEGASIELDTSDPEMAQVAEGMKVSRETKSAKVPPFLAANQMRLSLEETRGVHMVFVPRSLTVAAKDALAAVQVPDVQEDAEPDDKIAAS